MCLPYAPQRCQAGTLLPITALATKQGDLRLQSNWWTMPLTFRAQATPHAKDP